jgi:uncharacterized protein (DUF427 family)
MSLTLGSIAPLGRPTGGAFNFPLPDTPAHLLYLHDLSYRIRGEVDDTTVVDATAARMLHETRIPPRWYFPSDAVRADLLEPSPTVTHCPFKGDARYWNLRVGDRLIEDALWEYPDPLPGAIDLRGLLSPYSEKFDRWREEDEVVLGHPRDPFHRVDIRRSDARVTVRAGGVVVADSTQAVALAETGLPLRWYVPSEDVVSGALLPSDTSTFCAYKGVASYWSVVADATTYADVVWGYEKPIEEASAIAGYLSFLGDGINVEVQR